MKRLAVAVFGLMAFNTACYAANNVDIFDRLTSSVPLNGRYYGCTEIIFKTAFLKDMSKFCPAIKLNSASNTARTLCYSWANYKGGGLMTKYADEEHRADKNSNDVISSSQKTKNITCQSIKDISEDFLKD